MINKELNIPLYMQIYNDIKEKILNNEFNSEEFLPSERELSNNFKVERATTRRALELLVKDKLLVKIPGAGTKVIYNALPLDTIQISNNSIAFILPGDSNDKITQPFISDIFYNLEKECKKRNYSLFYTKLKSDEELPDIVLRKNVKGIVWLSHTEDELIFKASELGIPSVLISNYLNGFTSILIDNTGGSCQAVEYLIKLGHKKIAFISGISSYLNAIERMEGYRRALSNYQINYDPGYVKIGDWTFESGYNVMKDLLHSSSRPSSVFAANDMMALGAIKALNEFDIKVPDDFSVIGFDNIEQCNYSNPALSTVGADVKLIVKQAMKSLEELSDDINYPAVKILIPTSLIIRESAKSVK